MNNTLSAQRFELSFKAVRLNCLDKDGAPIVGADASGFIRREGMNLYLYTCWHVVTGHDVHGFKNGQVSPNRMTLSVTLKDTQISQAEITGNQTLQVPLYDSSGHPLWSQDRNEDPQAGLRATNLRAPFFHDAIKLRLPADAGVFNAQAIDEACFLSDHTLMPGDKVLIVGYPSGFSALGGIGQAMPVVLTRFIAATKIPGRKYEFLLDGLGTQGMSGGPVFIERDASFYLLGLYMGAILPNQVNGESEKIAALSICCDMTICWKRMPLQPYTVWG